MIDIANSYNYNNTYTENRQDFSFLDGELNERWLPRKISSEVLASSFARLKKHRKADRVLHCGSWLEFAISSGSSAPVTDGSAAGADSGAAPAAAARLQGANFCRERLCPMCAWRRSLKIFSHVSELMNHLGDEYRFLFLTLTVVNVRGEALSATIDRMNVSLRKLFRFPSCGVIRGYIRVIEVTRNKKDGSYHPHFHIILAVPPSYFKKGYISQSQWLDMWRSAYGDERITQVNIKAAKNKNTGETSAKAVSSAVAEIAKYSVKSKDMLYPENIELTDDIVNTLDSSLSGRRLITYGGIFRKAAQALNHDDVEDGDLVHIETEINDSLYDMIVTYQWSAGAYKLIKIEKGGLQNDSTV